MSKTLSLVLSLLIMMQSSILNFRDIVQLDDFLVHAEFHKQKYGDNLFDFLSKHYGKQKEAHHLESHDEHQDHDNLPLNHQSCNHSVVVFVLEQDTVSIPRRPQVADTSMIFFYQESFYKSTTLDIFQPPREA